MSVISKSVAWHAFTLELKEHKKVSVPGDIADVSDDALLEVENYANHTGKLDKDWETSMVERVLGTHASDKADRRGSLLIGSTSSRDSAE
jgi:hypothetical protein